MAKTISTFESSVAKNGQRSRISRSSASPAGPCRSMNADSAVPTPIQPVITWRVCIQANTQGMARREVSDASEPGRKVGREPIARLPSWPIGVTRWK